MYPFVLLIGVFYVEHHQGAISARFKQDFSGESGICPPSHVPSGTRKIIPILWSLFFVWMPFTLSSDGIDWRYEMSQLRTSSDILRVPAFSFRVFRGYLSHNLCTAISTTLKSSPYLTFFFSRILAVCKKNRTISVQTTKNGKEQKWKNSFIYDSAAEDHLLSL